MLSYNLVSSKSGSQRWHVKVTKYIASRWSCLSFTAISSMFFLIFTNLGCKEPSPTVSLAGDTVGTEKNCTFFLAFILAIGGQTGMFIFKDNVFTQLANCISIKEK